MEKIGYISDICYCEECKKRGFFEPAIKYTDGSEDYISNISLKHILSDYKQIGIQCFDTGEKEMHDYNWHKISEGLPDKCGIYDVKFKNCLGGITEARVLYTFTADETYAFCMCGYPITSDVIEWRYTSHEV